NLWLIEGEMPDDNDKHPDLANALVYRRDDRLYLMDTGAGPRLRAGIERALRDAGPAQVFTLLNSHGHLDHVGNNGLIRTVQADEKHHYLSKAGWPFLDVVPWAADLYTRAGEYYDPFAAFQAHRLKYRAAGVLRDGLALFVGQRRAMETLMSAVGFEKKWGPISLSQETIRSYETLPRQKIRFGDVTWSGWILGDDDVWVLEERGHSPDEVLFYVPEHRFLHTADLTFALFPTWPDSDGRTIRRALRKCMAMARAGDVQLLTDGHHHHVYRGRDEIVTFLETLLSDHELFRDVLDEILEEQDGLTVPQVYARLRERREPVVRKYLDLEFPHTPPSLQAVIAMCLLDMGYEAKGPWRRKRFYRLHQNTD
ncbi:MAG: MBL fold metallo-hydrolase, partial [Chloroflexi bacterium]|nr:MBL fold metallo-hydrolase [Chloroflexota bacterium]